MPESEKLTPIPPVGGIGLRGPHHDTFLRSQPSIGWVEVHSENYFAINGLAYDVLERVRADYPVSLHGVGLSLGSSDPLDQLHLRKLGALVQAINPGLVSEHLSWSSAQQVYLNDLLPMPYTEEAVRHFCERIDTTQNFLGRQILVENVSGYLEFSDSEMPEWDFVSEIARRSGAGILLDVNNIFVNAHNHQYVAEKFVDSVPAALIGEIHLAGHSEQKYGEHSILVDTHDAAVRPEVWRLYSRLIERVGARPTLIEWDSKLPSIGTLIDEAVKAQSIMEAHNGVAA